MKPIFAAFALLISLPAFANDSSSSSKQSQAKQDKQAKQAKIQAINRNPNSWIGKKVTLNGEVDRVGGAQMFVLDGDGWINDQILVIGKKMLDSSDSSKQQAGKSAPTFNMHDRLSVTGTVQRLTVTEIEREYSLDLDPEFEIEFEGSIPVVVADLSTVKKS